MIFYLVSLLGCGFAFWRGTHPERLAAAIYLAGAVATTAVGTHSHWRDFEPKIFIVDLIVLGGFWFVALTSRRFWPYWVTGWQLVGILVHIQKALLPGISASPYGYLSLYLAYPMLLLIVVASMPQVSRYMTDRR